MDIFNNFTLFISKLSKYRFIGFIALVFSIFFFNPVDIFAYTYVPEDIKITFYGANGSSDYCDGLSQCYNFVPDKIANRIQVQSNKISFTEGKQYKMFISLKLSVPTDYTIYDYYLSDYLVRNYNINVNKSDFKFLYWDDFGWFNAYQWDLEITVNPSFQGSGVSFDFYKSQATNQQIWILDVLDFHSELLSDSSDTNIIIDNQNKNTQDIIDNQNKNTQEEIESQKVCKVYDKNDILIDGQYLHSNGTLIPYSILGISDYINITSSTIKPLQILNNSAAYYCFYNINKSLISCYSSSTMTLNQNLTIPNKASYLRFTIDKNLDAPQLEICKNGNQALDDSINNLDKTNKGIWDTIKELPSRFLDMLIGLFIPEDFSFLDNFKDALESKLGFIAEIPISILDFMINLANANWETFDSISFPSIEIFGFNFWESQEISLQPAIDIFEPYKYITDILCVILCCNTLLKWYQSFTDGGGK